VHGGSHWAPFYTDCGVTLQKRFFDHFLKGSANGWTGSRACSCRSGIPAKNSSCATRMNGVARTKWTHFHLDPKEMSLSTAPFSGEESIAYDAMGEV